MVARLKARGEVRRGEIPTTTPGKNAAKTRGRPFEAGNPGRPKGARHKATIAAEALLDGEAEALTRKAIELAKGGDVAALRLCLDRVAPPRRDRLITFDLCELTGPADALAAMVSLIRAASVGEVTPGEAAAVMSLLDIYRRGFEMTELEARLAALEAHSA